MGLVITGVSVETVQGDTYTSFWVELLDISHKEKPSPSVVVELVPYRSENDRVLNHKSIELKTQDVPQELFHNKMEFPTDAIIYANADNGQITNQVRNMLRNGTGDSNYDLQDNLPPWGGLGVGNVETDMPV